MKTTARWQYFILVSVIVGNILGLGFARAGSVESVFTYQGSLRDGTGPANGHYDFSFRLLDAATLGNQVSTNITITNLVVSNGLFTARLDFGFAPFNGTAYWIEIGTRSNSLPTFTILSPRQPLTAVPLALYAVQAGSAATVFANSVSTASLQDGVVTSNKIASGQAVKSINGFKDNVVLGAAGTVVLTTNGNSLLMTGTGWSLIGNSGTSGTKNFLGTTDQQPLNLMANNQVGLRIEPTSAGLAPNLIGGYGATAQGLYGVTIAGGGATDLTNYAGDIFTSIGGGRGNQIDAGSYDATVAGGYQNVIGANAPSGVIGGGEYNTIVGDTTNATIAGGSLGTIGAYSLASVIGGGEENVVDAYNVDSLISGGWQNYLGWAASGSAILGGEQNAILDYCYNSTISGGLQNTNSGTFSVIAGGATNRVGSGAYYGVIGGGTQNLLTTNGFYSTIGGGTLNEIPDVYGGTIAGGALNYVGDLSDYSTISGGYDNYVQSSASYSTIPGGYEATTRNYGQMAYASGCTENYGDAQSSVFVLRRSTTNAVTSELFLDGASERIYVPTSSTISFQIMIVARTAAGASSCFEAKGGIKNLAGTITFLGGGVTLNTTSVASEITGITVPQLARDNTTQTMILRVTGVAGQTIRWVARVQTVEVGF